MFLIIKVHTITSALVPWFDTTRFNFSNSGPHLRTCGVHSGVMSVKILFCSSDSLGMMCSEIRGKFPLHSLTWHTFVGSDVNCKPSIVEATSPRVNMIVALPSIPT